MSVQNDCIKQPIIEDIVYISDKDGATERQEMACRLGQLITGLMNESGMMHSDPDDVKEILSLPGSSLYVESTAGSIEQVDLAVSNAIELLKKRDINYRRANGLLVNLSLDRFPKTSQVKQLVDAIDSHFDRLEITVLFNV